MLALILACEDNMITKVTHECPSCHKVVDVKGDPFTSEKPKGWACVSFNGGSVCKVICGNCVFKITKAVPFLKDLPVIP